MNEKQFTVSIIGGGIGGLVLAIGLIRRNVPVQIYEAAASFGEIGLGLTIGPAALRALHLIDPRIFELHESLVTTHADSPGYESFKHTWLEVVWATGDDVGKVLLELKAPPSGQTSVRRSDFLEALVNLVPKEIVHFHQRLVSLLETPDGVCLTFQDGTSVVADVVVGCDGIKSKVKEFMLPDEFEGTKPRYSGMYGYRAIVDMAAMVEAVGDRRARIATWHIGNGSYAVTYPIMSAKKVNIGLYTMSDVWDSDAWVRPASRDDMKRDFGHLGESVNAVMTIMPDSTQWAIFEHPHISTFCSSRVAILGDAAHASTPHQGAGAGQAIEDAYILAEVLSHALVVTPLQVISAFKAYDAVRRPRSQKVVTNSKENGSMLCLSFEGIGANSNRLKAVWLTRFQWLWNVDLQNEVNKAHNALMLSLDNKDQTSADLHHGLPCEQISIL